MILEKNCVSKLIIFFSNVTNGSNFEPLEVVGRDSETQLQVGGDLNKVT